MVYILCLSQTTPQPPGLYLRISFRSEEVNRPKNIRLMSHFVAAGHQSWFAKIFGFEETAGGRLGTFAFVRSQLRISQTPLNAHVLTTPQGKELWAGRFTQESLSHLRSKLQVSVVLHCVQHALGSILPASHTCPSRAGGRWRALHF